LDPEAFELRTNFLARRWLFSISIRRATLARPPAATQENGAGQGLIWSAAVVTGPVARSLAHHEMNGIPEMQSKQWSVQDFGQDVFGPCSALRLAQCSRK